MSKEKQIEFLKYYEPIKNNIWRYCLFLAGNRQNAEDLLGETIAAAYKNFEKVQSPKAFLSYMLTIASRIFYKYISKKNKYEYADEPLENLFSCETQPDRMADIKILLKMLEELPPEQKEAIILSEVEGFSREEISKIQNVAIETVKSRIYRAKQKLTKLMGVEK